MYVVYAEIEATDIHPEPMIIFLAIFPSEEKCKEYHEGLNQTTLDVLGITIKWSQTRTPFASQTW